MTKKNSTIFRISTWVFILLIAILFVPFIIRTAFFPPRPMFHNYRAEFWEKGPVRFWPTPPPLYSNTGAHQIYIDKYLNIFLLLISEKDPNMIPTSIPRAMYGYHTTTFTLDNNLWASVGSHESDNLILIKPDGVKISIPIHSGMATDLKNTIESQRHEVNYLTILINCLPPDHIAICYLKDLNIQ